MTQILYNLPEEYQNDVETLKEEFRRWRQPLNYQEDPWQALDKRWPKKWATEKKNAKRRWEIP